MVKKYTNYFKHILVYLISFVINYMIFVFLMNFINDNIYGIQIVNLISWIISMLFIFIVDKIFLPELVNENNSKELFQFILIRVLSLIIESIILFAFISVLSFDYLSVKLISLILLFFFNHFYVSRIKFN